MYNRVTITAVNYVAMFSINYVSYVYSYYVCSVNDQLSTGIYHRAIKIAHIKSNYGHIRELLVTYCSLD